MEGRRVTAKYEENYHVIVPIARVSSITYYTPRHREEQQAKGRSRSFDAILKERMKDSVMEENQTFQLYC